MSKEHMPVRPVRIPDDLWQSLTEWAQQEGIGNGEALRALLLLGMGKNPSTELRPAMRWMERTSSPGSWVFARVTPGAEWWHLDDAVGRIPGASIAPPARTKHRWWRLPADRAGDAAELFAGRPGRLILCGPVKIV